MAIPAESTRCAAVTKAGARCKRSGDPYCFGHRKLLLPGAGQADLPASEPPSETHPAISSLSTLKVPQSMMSAVAKMISDKVVTPVIPQSMMSEWVKALSANVVSPVIPQSMMSEWVKGLSANVVSPIIPQSTMSALAKMISDKVVTPVIPHSMMSEWVKALSANVTMPKITDETLGAMAKVMLAKSESSAWASAFATARSTSGVSTFKALYADSLSSLEADAEPLEFAAGAMIRTCGWCSVG